MNNVQRWHVAPGDSTCVFTGGLAQPIRCHSQERAKLVAAAPELLAVLEDIVRSEWTTVSLLEMTPQHRQRLERARALLVKAGS